MLWGLYRRGSAGFFWAQIDNDVQQMHTNAQFVYGLSVRDCLFVQCGNSNNP